MLSGTAAGFAGNGSTGPAESTADVPAGTQAIEPPDPRLPEGTVGDEPERDSTHAKRAAPLAPEPGALRVDASVPHPPAAE
jgi:hypothetical protein